MVAVKRLPVHHHRADYIFWSIGIIEFNSVFENRVPLKSVQGGMAAVAHFVTGHQQTQQNRVCYFHSFDVIFIFVGLN